VGFFLYFMILLTILLFLPLFLFGVKSIFGHLGFSLGEALAIILFSLIGSALNIPVFKIQGKEPIVKIDYYTMFGITYPVPTIVDPKPSTVVAINVGGAIVPTIISAYLWYKEAVYSLEIIVALALVILVVNRLAKPVQGMGIVVPAFVPPIIAAFASLIIAPADPSLRFSLAYIGGSLGTLIGADLMNINRLSELRAQIVSIGGAGTFDGVFMSGILAVIITALLS